ncbi:methyltransferase domain-containing protein [Methylobacterium sp. P31]
MLALRAGRAGESTMPFITPLTEPIARRVFMRLGAILRRRSGRWPPQRRQVTTADIAGTRPISHDFGWDRGTPIDRFYVERFLAANAADIRGRALEVGDATYCRQFGKANVVQQDVLNVNPAARETTIDGDLATPGTLPDRAFDCVVLTQTLHLVFDFGGALAGLAQAIAPGGVLLLTVPGISPIDRLEWSNCWFWSFTDRSLRRLADQYFPGWEVNIEQHGNIFAAISFLHGLALEEIDTEKLKPVDDAYPVIVTARLRRPAADV